MADNYGMEVKASVKLPTSADIDKQIRKLEKSISKLQVSGKFEESTLKNLTNQLNTLKANVATASFSQDALQNLTNQINNALQGIQINNIGTGKQTQQVGQNVGKQLKENISSALRSGIDSSSIDDFAKRLKGIGVADSTIDETVKRLRELEYTVEKVKGKFSEKDGVVSLTGLDIVAKDGADTLNIVERLNQKTKEWKREIGVTTSFKEQQQEIRDTANEADRLATILTKVEKAKGKSTVANKMFGDIDGADDVKTSMRELERLLSEFDNTTSLKDQELAWVKIDNAVKALNADIEKYNQRNNTNTSVDDEAAKLEALAKRVQDVKSKFTTGADGKAVSDYQNRIQGLSDSFEKYGATSDITKAKIEQLKETLAGFRKEDGTFLDDEALDAQANKFEQEFKEIKIAVDQAKLAFDKFTQPVSKEKATSLINRINTFLTKNTAITQDAKNKLQGYVDELEKGVDLSRWNEISGALKQTENSMRGLGKLGANLRQQFKQAAESFTQWLSVSSAVMFLVTKTRQAITELKDANTLLTEISKANDRLTESQLDNIGDNAYDTASRYGKKATDYLAGVQEMSRAGYQNAEAMGELSVKAQGAGDMTEDVANKFIVATDKAYKLNGSLIDLTKIMDGINYITNHNAINMTELSEGFSIVGSTAASFGVEANELTAALATMGASTQQSGSEVARAFRAILLNIRQVSDEEEGIDAEGLTKYEKACNALGVSLKNTVNGAQELRDPMEVLGELSKKYRELSDTDIRKVNLLNSVGGKLRATQLDALLRGWSDYEKMLRQFESGFGSMEQEAAKTADSFQGRLNTLSNTWTDTVENITDTNTLKGAVGLLNSLLKGVDTLTGGYDKLSSSVNTLFGLLGKDGSSISGTLGIVAGLLMKKNGVGKIYCNMPTLLRLYNNAI